MCVGKFNIFGYMGFVMDPVPWIIGKLRMLEHAESSGTSGFHEFIPLADTVTLTIIT